MTWAAFRSAKRLQTLCYGSLCLIPSTKRGKEMQDKTFASALPFSVQPLHIRYYSILRFYSDSHFSIYLVSSLHKSIAGRYRPVRVADGPITARYTFIKNASWVKTFLFLPTRFVIINQGQILQPFSAPFVQRMICIVLVLIFEDQTVLVDAIH